MLNNKMNKSLHRSDSVSSRSAVPDPWQIPLPVPKTNPVPKTWHLSTETHPLISAAGSPEAPRLASHRSTSEEILLEDELKLKNSTASQIKQQLAKALTLLYWLKTRATFSKL